MGNTAYCIWSYSMSPMGDAGATSGNSQACRDYHLGAAIMSSDAPLHCPHASGEAVCVDEEPTAADMFCMQYMATCSMYDSFNGDMAMCVMAYNSAPMGSTGATSGNSQACRDYHLGAAMSDAMLHCPHASGMAVCVDDVTTMAPMVQTHTISWGFQGVDVASLTIQVGDTVMWNFDQQSIHTITSGSEGDADAGSMFNSGDMAVGTSFMYTFDTAGTYPYFCARHPAFMMATITVEEAGGGGGSPAEMFCQGFWDTCSAYNPYADMAACVMDFEMVPMGETTDTSGTETSISLLTYPPYEGSWQSCRSHSPPLSLSLS